MQPHSTHTLAVVHLVRQSNGVEPLIRFLDSYDKNPGGMAHDLILVFKGFDGQLDSAHQLVLQGRIYQSLFVPDAGFDVAPYLQTARTFDHQHLCFLNSFSQLLDPQWLEKLHTAIMDPTVGIAGASGSAGTITSYRADARRKLWAHLPTLRGRAWLRHVRHMIPVCMEDFWYWLHIAPFPSPHLRTNAFTISRELFLLVAGQVRINTKFDAWCFEHGRRSLTQRVTRRGLRAVVVGQDGLVFDSPQWGQSNTFWQGEQSNLLVADNQTLRYSQSSEQERVEFTVAAWGKRPIA